MVEITSQIKNIPPVVLPKNQPSRVCFGQTQDKFESSQKQEEKRPSKTFLVVCVAAAVALGAILTKGKLWGKVTKETTTPSAKPSSAPVPPVVQATPRAAESEVIPTPKETSLKLAKAEKSLAISGKYLLRALAHKTNNKPEKALEAFDKAIKFAPENHRLYLERGLFHDEIGNTAGALADYYKTIEKNPECSHAYFNIANILSDSDRPKDLNKALNYANETIRLEGENELTVTLKRNILEKCTAVQSEFSPKQIAQKQAVISVLEDKLKTKYDNPDIYGQLAGLYEDVEEPQKAISCYNQVIKLDPKAHVAHSRLGALYFRMDNIDKAVEHYSKAIKLKPKSPVLYYNRAKLFIIAGAEKRKKALSDISKAIELKPNDVDFYKLRIKLNYALKNTSAVDADIKKLKELDKAGSLPK